MEQRKKEVEKMGEMRREIRKEMRKETKKKMNAACLACMIRRQAEGIKNESDEAKKLEYMHEVLKIILAADYDSAPVVTEKISRLRVRYYGDDGRFARLKREYNELMLKYERDVERVIIESEDSILTGIKFARVGNYIDFGAMGDIDNDKLAELIAKAELEQVDEAEYAAFRRDLSAAKKLVYLTDNCGEIVMDKLLIREIKKEYPELEITVIVRGDNVLNDATLQDAQEIGLTELYEVIGNGTGVAGTDLASISFEAKTKLESADLIVAKGQGNFESLYGCGLNIYYLFLCKCDWFVDYFGLERYSGVMINDRNLELN